MATTKSIFPEGSSLALFDDGTYGVVEVIYVDGMTAATELGQKEEAIAATGYTLASLLDVDDILLSVLRMDVKLLAKARAAVTVTWGVNDTPQFDGAWLTETYSSTIREPRGIDVNQDQIKVQYQPSSYSDAQWDEDWNQRRYNRGVTVPGFVNRPHIIGRRQVSAEEANKMSVHPQLWPATYVNHVNAADTDTSGGFPAIPAGPFLCSSMRVYSRNRENSYIIEAEWILDPLGHDPIILFMDPTLGVVPGDITIPAGMKLAWPTKRTMTVNPTDQPYGASRPQVVKDPVNFRAAPLSFDLRLYYAV